MRKWFHIVLLFLLAVSCGPRKISRDDMERIMTDILVQDQQIKQDRNLKKQADTSLVYEGILDSYGYDTDDFLYSLEYYLSDPSRMEKIMGDVAEKLEAETKVVAGEIEREQWRARFMRIYAQRPDTTLPRPRVRAADTLSVRFDADSVWFHHPTDTL
ncbi:MAG: DUF4296 domain-containing protein [Bacteroidales bacterium]|nr:DUF4296 domain-containing protein [Bacteroidales bacterium]